MKLIVQEVAVEVATTAVEVLLGTVSVLVPAAVGVLVDVGGMGVLLGVTVAVGHCMGALLTSVVPTKAAPV